MELGWSIAIETSNGKVGLWTCWLGDSIKLFYPRSVNVSDEMIMETLGVKKAKPVANERFGTRQWAKYYSEKLDDLGRVWIDNEKDHSYGYQLQIIRDKELRDYYCGHNYTNTISTCSFHFCTESEPEAPNCKKENIQPYKEKFINLLVEIAKLVGDIQAINLNSGLVLYTPEMLTAKGYELDKVVKGWSVCYYTRDINNNFEIMLKSGNSLVSWTTIIRHPATNELTAKCLSELLDSFDNAEDAMNCIPLIEDFYQKIK